MIRYIIIGPARSGTTVTHLCLAGHPNVSAQSDEVKVTPFFTQGISVFTYGNEHETEFKKGFPALFDALCTLNKPEKLLACGLKTAISSQSQAADVVRSIQMFFPEVKIILTLRDDIVAQFGSLELARTTGKWHSWVKSERELKGKLKIEKNKLYAYTANYLKMVLVLQQLKKTHEVFDLSYEKDILPGDLLAYQRLFHFLKLPETKITWLRSKKVAPAPDEYIIDYAGHSATVRELRQRFEVAPTSFDGIPEDGYKKRAIMRWVRRKLFRSSINV